MQNYKYLVFFEPLEEGGYNVVVPAIPEICTFGETLEDAHVMAMDAIRCYLESAIQLGESIPNDVSIEREPVKERLAITLKAA
jgi:predicted RNase H-like HicB family nuclease